MLLLYLELSLTTLTITGTVVWLVCWVTHVSQVKDFCREYGRGSFSIFRREFEKNGLQDGPGGYFNYATASHVHAGVIQFSGKGMMLGPIDFLLVQIWLKSLKRSRNTVKWE